MGLLQNANDNNDLPLFRNWVKKNKDKEDLTLPVTKIKLSSSEEWMLIYTDECLAMLNATSKIGKELWDNLQEFSGELKQLIIFPASGKLGFDLDFCDTPAFYCWDDEILEISTKQKKITKSITSINLTNAKLTTSQPKTKKSSVKSKDIENMELSVLSTNNGMTATEGKETKPFGTFSSMTSTTETLKENNNNTP